MASSSQPGKERHYVTRVGWLRAAVLGANDGMLSTSSLIIGVSSAAAGHRQVFLTGLAGLLAGAISMAAGEYVSVRSQADTERADLKREGAELRTSFDAERAELAAIYVERGLTRQLAQEVAAQLMAKAPLEAHARDELGISDATQARPVQAAAASAASFGSGALLPLLTAVLAPSSLTNIAVAAASLAGLAALGAAGARTGGAPIIPGVVRVVVWGFLAMVVTAGAGLLFGTHG